MIYKLRVRTRFLRSEEAREQGIPDWVLYIYLLYIMYTVYYNAFDMECPGSQAEPLKFGLPQKRGQEGRNIYLPGKVIAGGRGESWNVIAGKMNN